MIKLALPDKIFDLLYGDPGWRFEVRNRENGLDRSADRHYHTSTVADICEIPVSQIAAKNSVLLLWVTVPMLPQGLVVMKAWGFEYKSSFVWVKDKIGLGYWNRNQHELLLLGTRGKIRTPPPGLKHSSVIEAPRRRHSEKPTAVYEMLEAYFPGLSKVELFARSHREGWHGWGLEFGAGPASRAPEAPKPDHEHAATGVLGDAQSKPPNEDVSLA
jgi:N6-adenosine-specific RNA methylase IME4